MSKALDAANLVEAILEADTTLTGLVATANIVVMKPEEIRAYNSITDFIKTANLPHVIVIVHEEDIVIEQSTVTIDDNFIPIEIKTIVRRNSKANALTDIDAIITRLEALVNVRDGFYNWGSDVYTDINDKAKTTVEFRDYDDGVAAISSTKFSLFQQTNVFSTVQGKVRVTDLAASFIGTDQIRLTWDHCGTCDAVTYEIRRDAGSWIDVGSNKFYLDSGLTANTAYTYDVRASSTDGVSQNTTLNVSTIAAYSLVVDAGESCWMFAPILDINNDFTVDFDFYIPTGTGGTFILYSTNGFGDSGGFTAKVFTATNEVDVSASLIRTSDNQAFGGSYLFSFSYDTWHNLKIVKSGASITADLDSGGVQNILTGLSDTYYKSQQAGLGADFGNNDKIGLQAGCKVKSLGNDYEMGRAYTDLAKTTLATVGQKVIVVETPNGDMIQEGGIFIYKFKMDNP